MFDTYPTLLVTKLYRPPLHVTHIPRVALHTLLDMGGAAKLILIAGGAGWGKTTLAAAWCETRARQVAWLSLDVADDDPPRFLAYCIAAIQTRHPHIGQDLLPRLLAPNSPAPETVIAQLINVLAALPERLYLVLDDYHNLTHPAIHAAITYLLEHQPPQLTLLILSRAEPPLPLARLRARHELVELRPETLRFTPDEAARYLNDGLHLGLSSASVQALAARTEGWITGLHLAALALQKTSDYQADFVAQFTGSHRYVLDYLLEEVLWQQPDDVRLFLLITSILPRLNADLCDAILETNTSRAMLDKLEQQHLFVIPLDDRRYWVRYHHLFADLLRARLQAEYPASIPLTYQRAAGWYAANNLPEEAVELALAGTDYHLAAQLVTGAASSVMRRGEVLTLLRWYGAFPADFVLRQPQLRVQFGVAFALNGRWQEAETLLADIPPDMLENMPADDRMLLSYLVANIRPEVARLGAVAAASADQPDHITQLLLGLMASIAGDYHGAARHMQAAQTGSEQTNDMQSALTVLFHRCRLLVFAGELQAAAELCQQAITRIERMGESVAPLASLAYSALGRVYIEWNRFDDAQNALTQAIVRGAKSGLVTGILSSSTMMLAEVMQARGDEQAANMTATQALDFARQHDPPPEVYWLQTYRARLWLQQGRAALAAAEWGQPIAAKPLPPSLFYPPAVITVTRARLLIAQRHYDAAIALLLAHLNAPPDLLTPEAALLLAVARQQQGNHANALLMLERALTLAEKRPHVFTVLRECYAPLAKLLQQLLESQPDHAAAQAMMALLPAGDDGRYESLSERELAILRLIVAGYSNDEIAGQLVVALSTVKWYINGLYGKLQVRTRAQAIARAHELRLLE